jgi:acetyl-CoA acetyltransferase
MTDIAIIGIGMHEFGRTEGASGASQGVVAVRRALADAGLQWQDIQFAVGGSMQGPAPDTMVARLGLTGVPFTNVINGCATGGTALSTAASAIESGRAEIALALGYDKHERGAFRISSSKSKGRDWYGGSGLALTTQFFGMKINRYMHQYGISQSTLAKVAEKAFRNGSKNPMAWRRKPLSEQEILDSAMLSWPLTQYMFCSPGEGGVALVLCDAKVASRYTDRPVYLRASVMRTRRFGSFEVLAPSLALEHSDGPTVDASRAAYEAAGIGPDEVDVAQLQDTESGAEVMHMAENGFCEHGEQEAMIQAGETEIGGRLPVNTDGGCLANGEPIGASGLRQVYENVLQLRGDAGERQVPGDPRVAYTHVYGAPGISAVTILTR